MKFLIALICVVFLLFQLVFGSVIDSLQSRLSTAGIEEKYEIYLELAEKYTQLKDSTRALFYCNKILSENVKNVNDHLKADALLHIGNIYYTLEKYERAIPYYTQALTLGENDTPLRAEIFHKLGNTYLYLAQYDQAQEMHKKALEIRKKLQLEQEQSFTLNNLGIIAEHTGQYAQAIEYYIKALETAKKHNNSQLIAQITNNLGNVYDYLGDYDSALTYYLQSLAIEEDRGNTAGIASTLCNIGLVYTRNGELKKSLIYYQRALALEEAFGSKRKMANMLHNIASIEKNLGDTKKALQHLKEVKELETELGDKRALITTLHVIGDILTDDEDYLQALDTQKQALKIAEEIGEDTLYTISLFKIGSIYYLTGSYQKAEENLLNALKISQKTKSKSVLLDILNTLSALYEKLNNSKSAYSYLLRYTSLRDSLLSQESSDRFLELQAKYESQNREREISLLRKEQDIKKIEVQKQKLLRNVVILLTVLIIIIALIILSRYKYKTKANEELQELNNKLDDLAKTDPLTKLSNRRNILEKIEYQQIVFERYGRSFSVLLADIDDFKTINDTYGHDAGDHILISLGKLIGENIRKQDFIGRWGGDELILLLPDTSLKGGKILAEKIRTKVKNTSFHFNHHMLTTSLTIGVAEYKYDMGISDLIKKADKALYMGKNAGKNTVICNEE